MIRRSMAILAWLIGGHAILGGLYWALLQTPESNVFTLAVSALLVIGMLLWVSIVEGVGLLAWRRARPMRGLLADILRRVWWVVPALLVFGAVWWATGALFAYFAAHAGEIDAWFIANAGWVRTAWLHTTIGWVLYFVRFAMGLSLALALLAAGLRGGASGAASFVWVRRALSWRTLVTVSAAMFAIWAGPWQLAYWRPASLPSTWAQPAFAGAKLCVLFVVMNALWMVVLWAVGQEASRSAAEAVEATPERAARGPQPSDEATQP
ncbi:MAG: hypothetical protein AB1806_03585 [Acidobacteriota bacterium]